MRHLTLFSILFFAANTCYSQQDSLRNLDINLENYQYPFPVKFLELNAQGQKLKMAYMDIPPAIPNNKVIMLLHGKNFNGAYWDQTAKELSKLGYRSIVPDQIGFGKSSKPRHYQYSFHQLAENTKLILDHLNVNSIILLGHSMGGMVATRFALMYPKMVSRLILENPIGLEDYKLKVPFQTIDNWYSTEMKADYNSIKNYQLTNYYHNKWKPEYAKWVNLLAGWTLNKDYSIIAWNSALTYDMIYTQPVCYEFEYIAAPTLLIIGQRDRSAVGKNLASEEARKTMGNYPELGRLTKSKIKNSQLVELDNIGHLPHIEDFERFIKPVAAFLKK